MPPADPLPTAQAAHEASRPRGVNAPWPIHPSRHRAHRAFAACESRYAPDSSAGFVSDIDEEFELEWASEREQWDSQIDDWDLAEKPSGGCNDVEQRWQQLVAKAESKSARSYNEPTHPAAGMGDVQQKTPYVPQINKSPRPNVRALLASPAAESHNQHRRLPPLEDEERIHATDTRALLAVPQRLQTARSVPPTRAIIGALIIGVLACAVVFARWWFTERQAAEHIVPAASTHAGQPSPLGTAGKADKQSQTTPAAITVHVAGRVTKPGVVTVPAGSRASQAIAAAGGFARGSDARSINMAKPLSDGEHHRRCPG
ncbi:SLBB domain [Dermatophilus congolensis]|uniref:SLBB domain n=1 Tax=Dermatophilus congolensis TaxID=1863 RepID=A0A239VL57_9MICO|nr:SLBB domain [Dermatophilus congolensis]